MVHDRRCFVSSLFLSLEIAQKLTPTWFGVPNEFHLPGLSCYRRCEVLLHLDGLGIGQMRWEGRGSAYNPGMMRFDILPSPTPSIVLNRYEKTLYPFFNQLFETPSPSAPVRLLVRDPQEAFVAVILENRSEKPITAWRFRWQFTNASNQQRTTTVSGDSYAVDVFRPIADAASRNLIAPSGCVNEAHLNHILSGGGFVGSSTGKAHLLSGLTEVTFEIHLIVFVDGEIAGPDPDDYAVELQGRKRAAEFVAKQIRMAQAEGRDVTPVLTALVETPSLGSLGSPQGDPLFHSVRHYAGDYLRHMHRKIGALDMAEAKLRHLENRPTLPDFYRRAVE